MHEKKELYINDNLYHVIVEPRGRKIRLLRSSVSKANNAKRAAIIESGTDRRINNKNIERTTVRTTSS